MIGCVIGDGDMVTGFRLVGVEGTEVSSVEETKQALNKALSRSDLAIIIISEAYAANPVIRDQLDKIRQERVTPLIVALPGTRGPQKGIPISDMISKILGIKI
jgi:vacuolar-type H+-ATPase subunit F/Vma7